MQESDIRIQHYRDLVEENLERCLPVGGAEQPDLLKAMRYSLSGGKRFRPVLTLACGAAAGGSPESVIPAGLAMECIHASSLILDDLPSMDNGMYRRGHRATHLVFGESTAVLAAHALLAHAFRLLAGNAADAAVSKETGLWVIGRVADCLGLEGLAGGQYMDLEAASGSTGYPVGVKTIHARKTASLFVASATAGAALCGAGDDTLRMLASYAEYLGLAFQSVDDALDTGERGTPGDPETARRTAMAEANEFTQQAMSAIQPLGTNGVTLAYLATMMIRRGS
ncbi:MAG: polyprenyl synthetase family protein [Candidatus Eisenbacteria sp.]|nr:polyprenyl synthetase family protein [Candidatus Eisenbacteria bacterium]